MTDNLDPDSWAELEAAWQQAMQAGFEHYQTLDQGPVWRPCPEEVKDSFRTPVPRTGRPVAELVGLFRDRMLPYSNGNTHPGFFGWVHGGGNLYGALGEMCAALMNSNLGGRDHVAVYVERQVLQWCRQLFNFPASSSGILTTGTAMATLLALAVARQRAAGDEVKAKGLTSMTAPLVGYASEQSHNSVLKAFQLLGLGGEHLRAVPVNDDFTMDTEALAEQIRTDRQNGLTPFCAIATAGTVNTGAIDDLVAIQEICTREQLWLHIDAAFGGTAILLEEYQEALAGISRADSVAFDFHKWFQVPYSVGGLLVRDGDLHQATFSERKEYLAPATLGLAGGAPWFCEFGPELSRSFLALKVWFTFQGLGTERLAAVVRKHCRLADELAQRIDAEPQLERLAPVSLNIVCFRYRADDPSIGDALNRAIVTQLHLRGLAAPSSTTLNGRAAIRVAIVNHRTEAKQLNDLLDAVLKLGRLFDTTLKPLMKTTRWYLAEGGDTRLELDQETGFNRYGSLPYPRDEAITFSASTATSVSSQAYAEAEQCRQRLLHDCALAGSLAPLRRYSQELADTIATTFGFHDLEADLHLSPSGTDSQMQAVAAIVATKPDEQWTSIVCGSDETGSGTELAVTGRHFDETTCLGVEAEKGGRLEGMPEVAFLGVPFRGEDGELHTLDHVDAMIWQAVSETVEAGRRVILHAMDQSRMGSWAPSPPMLNRIRRHFGEAVQVIVDACQLRLDAEDLRDHLEKGDILLLTGSKFFTGPTFSGVAVFPQSFTQRLDCPRHSLPRGLADYIPHADLGSWQECLPEAQHPPNTGMYLRWQAALEEARRYYLVPKEQRLQGLGRFCEEVMGRITAHPLLELLVEPSHPCFARTDMLGDELSIRRTIFPFLVRHHDGSYLTPEEARTLYEKLNCDIGDEPGIPAAEKELAAKCCHIGQPTEIPGKKTAALRISAGARIISQCWQDGDGNMAKIEEELEQISTILDKISLCVDTPDPLVSQS
ncbi:pyridoxal phosphate-dependent decarboxylase family protein [Desulfurivibrio dismutans]|uniref:pyridoxal phosphate-dependent decarboxylase family protein n=1 Tax=Desulfurivibrio dismutans TaxID=1398908 RepID=UPI0023DA8560|nr:pyridoxal-dependent decarboxylase [Desulfurivibrio alkaliphilus]MDF1614080.1 pyridoxal-dependent decarboxylase [Desulfurivibrio alkaliphilus]